MPPQLHTYHHTPCSTLLLCSPYALPNLPRRAPPSLDRAIILPLPALGGGGGGGGSAPPSAAPLETNHEGTSGGAAGQVLPSLLSKELKPARRAIVVRKVDGFEKRREWRCGRCGAGVGYEIIGPVGEGGGEDRAREEGGRVMYFFEGALCEVDEEEMEGGRG